MKTITKTIELFEYTELNEKAKEKVKNDFINDYTRSDFLYDDIKQYLKDTFKNSELDVTFSLSYCQGDGLNIYGNLNLYDFIDIWNATQKEKKTIEFYIDVAFSNYRFEENNHYSYSCKFIDKKYLNDTIEEFIENLEYNSIKNINTNIIKNFFNDMIDYFQNLDNEFENDGYNYLYNIEDEEIIETCNINEWLFTEDGTMYCQ